MTEVHNTIAYSGSLPVNLYGTKNDVYGNIIWAVPSEGSEDCIIFGFDGLGRYKEHDLVDRVYFTLHRDGKIRNMYVYVNDGILDSLSAKLKDGTSVNAADFKKTSVPTDLADKVVVTDYGVLHNPIVDSTDVANMMAQILEKSDTKMRDYFGYGLNSIGFSHYK